MSRCNGKSRDEHATAVRFAARCARTECSFSDSALAASICSCRPAGSRPYRARGRCPQQQEMHAVRVATCAKHRGFKQVGKLVAVCYSMTGKCARVRRHYLELLRRRLRPVFVRHAACTFARGHSTARRMCRSRGKAMQARALSKRGGGASRSSAYDSMRRACTGHIKAYLNKQRWGRAGCTLATDTCIPFP